MREDMKLKKAVSIESAIILVLAIAFFGSLGSKMGAVNMINTMMATSYDLLISTVFFIMAIAVIMSAFSEVLSEFGIISIANIILSPLIKPIYGLPGASIIGIFSTYFSDNPAILALAKNKSFRGYFKKYQLLSLANLGTAFGMGLIVTAFIASITSPTGENLILAVVIGNVGAIIGSIISTRMMLYFTAKEIGKEAECDDTEDAEYDMTKFRVVREGSFIGRFLAALLDGGKQGVNMGLEIIPGVLIICTIVQMLTSGPSAEGVFTGSAYEGIALLPQLAEKLKFIIQPLFGFENPACIAVPITALGAAGAAIALIPKMVATGVANANNVAVFTAMCMCWSGYLSTHVAMMESLGYRSFAGKAIFCHTIAGIFAGISANLLFKLVTIFV